jgi:hypothetical protein
METHLLQAIPDLRGTFARAAVEVQQFGSLPDDFGGLVTEHRLHSGVTHGDAPVGRDNHEHVGADTGDHDLKFAFAVQGRAPLAVGRIQQRQQPEKERIGNRLGDRQLRVRLQRGAQRGDALDGDAVTGQGQRDAHRRPEAPDLIVPFAGTSHHLAPWSPGIRHLRRCRRP